MTQSTAAAQTARLALDQDLTIYHAATLKTTLLSALEGAEQIELDLSAVCDIDTAGLQLLLLLKREARAQGKTVLLMRHSAPVREAIDFCNLAAEFGDPMVLPA